MTPDRGRAAIDDLEARKPAKRAVVRSTNGLPATPKVQRLNASMRDAGTTWYPLVALSFLVIVDGFQTQALFVLSPDVSSTLGIGPALLSAGVLIQTVATAIAAVLMSAYAARSRRRGLITIVTAFGWSISAMFTGFVINIFGLMVFLILNGISNGSVLAVHPPLLMDSYPPAVRARSFSLYRSAQVSGQILAPLSVGLLTAILGFTWRGAFLIMGLVCVLISFTSLGLRDPGTGGYDTNRARGVVRGDADPGPSEPSVGQIRLGFFETARRLMLIPTIRRLLVVQAVEGMLTAPLLTYLFFFLDDRWGMGPGARSVLYGLAPLAAFPVLVWFGRRAERIFMEHPAKLVRLESWFLVAGSLLLGGLVLAPVFPLMVACFVLFFASVSVLLPADNMIMLSIVPAEMRTQLAALKGIFLAGVGGFAGLILLSGTEQRLGIPGAIATLMIPGLIAAALLRSAGRTVSADLDRMVDDLVEQAELTRMKAAGESLPLLSCRGLDCAYGRLQVLFGVDFVVDDGEMVALLGTNGAGKSTLLRAIAGLTLPQRGRVQFQGADITYLDAERRVSLGISQVPGGRGIFDTLSVVENLRVYGYTLGRDRRSLEQAIERSLDVFPQLAKRRNVRAAVLSGGQQQMLALARAFILSPRLLLIDELSLGLAPVVVSQLLEILRDINGRGTAVVLVEQSVNLALSVVDRCYFMEKGEIRFEGAAQDLLGRQDLLRSVFLEGASSLVGEASSFRHRHDDVGRTAGREL